MVELYDKNKDTYSILARLPTEILCLEWEKLYVDKPFFGKKPKIDMFKYFWVGFLSSDCMSGNFLVTECQETSQWQYVS